MFTGIVHGLGSVAEIDSRAGGRRVSIEAGELDLGDVRIGDSIAVNGVCLTVVERDGGRFAVDVSPETLRCTTLGALKAGSRVNLEAALRLGDRLGGHLVSGHVDGVTQIIDRREDSDCVWVRVAAPATLARYISRKGSVCIDGVSLTVNAVDGDSFELQIIPHTQRETLFGSYRSGDAVNIEVDLIARYLERLLPGV